MEVDYANSNSWKGHQLLLDGTQIAHLVWMKKKNSER